MARAVVRLNRCVWFCTHGDVGDGRGYFPSHPIVHPDHGSQLQPVRGTPLEPLPDEHFRLARRGQVFDAVQGRAVARFVVDDEKRLAGGAILCRDEAYSLRFEISGDFTPWQGRRSLDTADRIGRYVEIAVVDVLLEDGFTRIGDVVNPDASDTLCNTKSIPTVSNQTHGDIFEFRSFLGTAIVENICSGRRIEVLRHSLGRGELEFSTGVRHEMSVDTGENRH